MVACGCARHHARDHPDVCSIQSDFINTLRYADGETSLSYLGSESPIAIFLGSDRRLDCLAMDGNIRAQRRTAVLALCHCATSMVVTIYHDADDPDFSTGFDLCQQRPHHLRTDEVAVAQLREEAST